MQPWENMKSQKSYKQAVWLENIDQSRSKTRMLTFLHHIEKSLAEISKMYLQQLVSFSKTSMATTKKMIWQALQNRRSVVQGADEVGRNLFFLSVIF